jgi:hypothetical protein
MPDHHSGTKRSAIVIAVLPGLVLLSAGIIVYVSNQRSQPTPSTGIAYGVNVDMTALIPDTPYTVSTASGGDFFTLAAQLGINTLRITDVRWAMTGQEYAGTTWNNVFNEAEHYHINIILLLVDGGNHTALEHAHTLLGQDGLARYSSLWMVDLDNEPDVDNPQVMAELKEEAAYVHQVAPGVSTTIGGWKHELPGQPTQFRFQDPSDIPRLISLVDVVSVHLYQFDQGLQLGFTPQQWVQRNLSAARQQAQGKPILLEEFGAGNGVAPTTDPTPTGSPQWQTYVYRSVLEEVKAEHAEGVIGAIAWIIVPRPSMSPQPTNYERNMVGWSFVLNHGRHLLPAAQTFSTVEHGE